MEGVDSERALGQRLQNARKKAGMTQQELCQKAGLSYSTLAKIERGAIKSPSIFTIQNIAGVLGTSLDDLIGAPKAPTATPKKRSKSGVSFVYFDINGCIVRFFHRAFSMIAEDTGASPDVIETVFWHYNDAVCRGDITMAEFNKALAERMGTNKLDWADYYLKAIEPITEMHDMVKWASDHYNIGLLSNIMPGLIDAMLKKGIIPDLPYKAIVDSSEVGAIKPEAKIYQIAQGLTDCQPSEILLVDDSRANIMAAEKAGWHVLWFDDYRPEESIDRIRSALQF